MKTITEFFGPALASALVKDKELAASGKTAEELPSARESLFSELTRYEGEKLKHFLAALEAISSKPERVKRVLVLQGAEGEKGPKAALNREGFAYCVEYFPHAHGAAQPARPQEEDRRGRKGRRGERSSRGRRPEGGGEDRAPRTPRPPRAPLSEGVKADAGGEGMQERRPRRPRAPKGPGPVGIAAQGKPLPKPRSLTADAVPQTPSEPSAN